MGLEADWHWRLCYGVRSFKLQTWQVFNGKTFQVLMGMAAGSDAQEDWAWQCRYKFCTWLVSSCSEVFASGRQIRVCDRNFDANFVLCSCCQEWVHVYSTETYIYRIMQVNMVFHGYAWYFTQTSQIFHANLFQFGFCETWGTLHVKFHKLLSSAWWSL